MPLSRGLTLRDVPWVPLGCAMARPLSETDDRARVIARRRPRGFATAGAVGFEMWGPGGMRVAMPEVAEGCPGGCKLPGVHAAEGSLPLYIYLAWRDRRRGVGAGGLVDGYRRSVTVCVLWWGAQLECSTAGSGAQGDPLASNMGVPREGLHCAHISPTTTHANANPPLRYHRACGRLAAVECSGLSRGQHLRSLLAAHSPAVGPPASCGLRRTRLTAHSPSRHFNKRMPAPAVLRAHTTLNCVRRNGVGTCQSMRVPRTHERTHLVAQRPHAETAQPEPCARMTMPQPLYA